MMATWRPGAAPPGGSGIRAGDRRRRVRPTYRDVATQLVGWTAPVPW